MGLIAPKYRPGAAGGGGDAPDGDRGEAGRRPAGTGRSRVRHDRPQPYFFKRWPAREDEARNRPLTDAALATSAAPTYFPSHEVDGHALVDGGVFRREPHDRRRRRSAQAPRRRAPRPDARRPPGHLHRHRPPRDGIHAVGGEPVGKLGWILPQDGEPPILATVLGGSSDGVDHWTETLVNEPPPHTTAEEIGHGPRFFRLQVDSILRFRWTSPRRFRPRGGGEQAHLRQRDRVVRHRRPLLRAGRFHQTHRPPSY